MARMESEGSTRRKERVPSFFKVLIGDFSSKLRIPLKFAKHLENIDKSQTFQVWNSARECWSISIERDQNILYLKEGWREFVQNNALELGDFVVFSYSGISDFDVTVYGKDCCEKNAVAANEKKTDLPSREGKKNEVDQPVVKDQKHGTNTETIDNDSDCEIEHEISMTSSHDQQQPPCQKTSQENSSALEASKFISKHPSFQICMPKSYVRHGYLNLPRRFVMQYIEVARRYVTLRISKKSWSVKLDTSGYRLRLREGWRAFVESNSLKIGDTCIFQALQGTPNELQVSIIRAKVD